MTQKNKNRLPPKLRRLNILLEVAEKLRDEEPTLDLGNIPERVRAIILEEYRKLNWHTVSPIIDGCARGCIYEGSLEDCLKYTRSLVKKEPSWKNNLIITPV